MLPRSCLHDHVPDPTVDLARPSRLPRGLAWLPVVCCAAGACTRASVLRDMRVTPPLATQVLLQFDVNDGVRTPAFNNSHRWGRAVLHAPRGLPWLRAHHAASTLTMQAGVVVHSALLTQYSSGRACESVLPRRPSLVVKHPQLEELQRARMRPKAAHCAGAICDRLRCTPVWHP